VAIEPMKKITLAVEAERGKALAEWLYARKAVDVQDIASDVTELPPELAYMEADSRFAELQITKLERVADLCRQHASDKQSFLDGLFCPKTIVTSAQLREAIDASDLDELHDEAERLRGLLAEIDIETQHLEQEIKRLKGSLFLGKTLPHSLAHCHYVSIDLYEGSATAVEKLQQEPQLAGLAEWQVLVEDGRRRVVCAASLPKDAEKVRELTDSAGLKKLEPPDIKGTVADEINRRREELSMTEGRGEAVASEAIAFAENHREVLVLIGYWQSERFRAGRLRQFLLSRHLCVVRGFVRAAEAASLEKDLAEAFPGAVAVFEDPTPEDDVPVSIRVSRPFRPFQLLVSMFGLPDYFAFDPTSFIALSFIAFIGICFSDVGYGLMLILTASLLRRKYRGQQHLKPFFTLFLYAGISTVFFGLLMGSWFSTLPEYLGENNPLQRLRVSLQIFDPMTKPMIGLIAALAIGAANQFYAIILRTYGDIRRGRIADAVFDGVLWLLFLPGLILLLVCASNVFSENATRIINTVAIGIVIASALGLVLTQGRNEKSVAGRIGVGIISLYGIMGSYGTTSFLGDVLSYSRLLALGMATSVVGMAFNLLAGMVLSVPVVGILGFIAIVAMGHSFNFIMSILSAFVHSARLIYLEFFSRFYSGGAQPFVPFGFRSDTVEVTDPVAQ